MAQRQKQQIGSRVGQLRQCQRRIPAMQAIEARGGEKRVKRARLRCHSIGDQDTTDMCMSLLGPIARSRSHGRDY